MILTNALINSGSLLIKLLSVPGIIFALSLKGYAQAWTAKKLGDNTPEMDGKLTLNPLAHLDIIGFLCILLIGIGWGKPVRTNPRNYENIKRDSAIQIMSGPVGLILGSILCCFFGTFFQYLPVNAQIVEYLSEIIIYAATICISLAIFYLLPLPGLDGYNFIVNFLPYSAYKKLYNIEKYSMFIFLGFILLADFTNILSYIMLPGNILLGFFYTVFSKLWVIVF